MLDEINEYIRQPIPINDLRNDLITCNVYTPTVLEYRDKARHDLLLAKEKFRHPTEKGLTDFDRRTMLDADIADQIYSYDKLVSLSEALERRFSSISMLLT